MSRDEQIAILVGFCLMAAQVPSVEPQAQRLATALRQHWELDEDDDEQFERVAGYLKAELWRLPR